MHLIIDADPIVYRCGFAAERTDYHLVVESPAGEVTEVHFTPKPKKGAGQQMKDWLLKHSDWEVLDKSKDVHPDTEEEALEAVRTQIFSIEKECREYTHVQEFGQITVLLSGPGNYREVLATVFPYKGNRDSEHKPYWYQSIRNNLTSEWGARVVHGREADDEASILAHNEIAAKSRFVVATIDKDLDQIPGPHYNYLKQVYYAQSARDARNFFYQQALSGDPTDGIPGCWKTGETKAQQFISKYGHHTNGNLWEAIVREYVSSKHIPGCPYVDRNPAAVALETARLVYLQKAEGELWIPSGPPHDKLPEFKDDE